MQQVDLLIRHPGNTLCLQLDHLWCRILLLKMLVGHVVVDWAHHILLLIRVLSRQIAAVVVLMLLLVDWGLGLDHRLLLLTAGCERLCRRIQCKLFRIGIEFGVLCDTSHTISI
jgi:hypothetical protein